METRNGKHNQKVAFAFNQTLYALFLTSMFALAMSGCRADMNDAPKTSVRALLPDADGDGVADSGDNCPAVANANQADLDRDGVSER